MKCYSCQNDFEPKPKAYNVKYCSKQCKENAYRNRYGVTARQRQYSATRQSPAKYNAYLESNRRAKAKVRQWLADYKTSRGCIDCGYKEHSAALQLDHEGTKSIAIADARSSIERLEVEIKNGQCVVRCANCHSIKTWERKNASSR